MKLSTPIERTPSDKGGKNNSGNSEHQLNNPRANSGFGGNNNSGFGGFRSGAPSEQAWSASDERMAKRPKLCYSRDVVDECVDEVEDLEEMPLKDDPALDNLLG